MKMNMSPDLRKLLFFGQHSDVDYYTSASSLYRNTDTMNVFTQTLMVPVYRTMSGVLIAKIYKHFYGIINRVSSI